MNCPKCSHPVDVVAWYETWVREGGMIRKRRFRVFDVGGKFVASVPEYSEYAEAGRLTQIVGEANSPKDAVRACKEKLQRTIRGGA